MYLGDTVSTSCLTQFVAAQKQLHAVQEADHSGRGSVEGREGGSGGKEAGDKAEGNRLANGGCEVSTLWIGSGPTH